MSVSLGFLLTSITSLFAIKPRRQLREMYVFLLLFSFAASLITVFEPIFFYTQGIPLWRIALYYALHYMLYAVLMPLGGMFAARFGYERSLTLSTPLFVLYFLTLVGLAQYPELFWVALVVLTVFKVLYWPAYHANFASYTDSKNRGTEQSWVRFVEYGASVAGPILGGVVAKMYGFPVLFLMAGMTVALAGIVLLRTRERPQGLSFAYTSAWQIIFSRQHRQMVVGMLGWGEDLVYLAIWPIWLMIMVGSVARVGAIASISAVVATIACFIVGEMTDRISPRRMIRFSVPYMIVAYMVRMLVMTPWLVGIGDILARTAAVGVSIPIVARLYKQAKRVGPLEYAVAFETVLAIGKAFTALVLVVVFIILPVPSAFIITFALAAALSLLYLVL